ncbi:partial ATP-dependent zinc metalloprotease FtsH, partial [Anaerolineae bacterium]
MDLQDALTKELVQLARLALAGRRQDVEMYLRRLARKTAQERPEIAEALSSLLTQGLTRQSPLRGEATDLLPVDRDSRLELMRVEAPDDIDVAPLLPAEILRQLESVLSEREKEADLFKAGLAPTKSLLFTGPPGVGKTISARWIAKKLGKPLLTLDLSAVMSSYLGRTGTNVRFVLDYAKQRECVLLLDELDAIAKRRDDGSEIGELKRLVTVLLQEIDDWPPTGLLIAATNHASLLDPAVWRRFEL